MLHLCRYKSDASSTSFWMSDFQISFTHQIPPWTLRAWGGVFGLGKQTFLESKTLLLYNPCSRPSISMIGRSKEECVIMVMPGNVQQLQTLNPYAEVNLNWDESPIDLYRRGKFLVLTHSVGVMKSNPSWCVQLVCFLATLDCSENLQS